MVGLNSTWWRHRGSYGCAHPCCLQVYAFDMASLTLKDTFDLSAHGRVWSLLMGPYGKVLALVWEEGQVSSQGVL